MTVWETVVFPVKTISADDGGETPRLVMDMKLGFRPKLNPAINY